MDPEGASNNERLLAAARDDNEDMLSEIFELPGTFDINHQDGLGNTALHYAVTHASSNVLEHILCHEECDVDPVNKLEKATPLHLAVRLEHPVARVYFVEELLTAGADYTIRNKDGQTALDLVNPDDDKAVVLIFRKFQAEENIDKDDIAYEDDDDVAGDSD